MCPACIVTAAFVIAGGSSAGGLTVFAVKRRLRRTSSKEISKQSKADTKKESV